MVLAVYDKSRNLVGWNIRPAARETFEKLGFEVREIDVMICPSCHGTGILTGRTKGQKEHIHVCA